MVDVPEPAAEGKVLVDVHALGVAFPDLLLSAGQYQLKPEPPFTLGVDFAGVVREAPEGSASPPGTGSPAACRTAAGPTWSRSTRRASSRCRTR